MSDDLVIKITKKELASLQLYNPECYQFIRQLVNKQDDMDYCETLDIEKLKSECSKKYFLPEELFPKEAILEAAETLLAEIKVRTEDVLKAVESMIDNKEKPTINKGVIIPRKSACIVNYLNNGRTDTRIMEFTGDDECNYTKE